LAVYGTMVLAGCGWYNCFWLWMVQWFSCEWYNGLAVDCTIGTMVLAVDGPMVFAVDCTIVLAV
jgi:hypothetical protein